MKYFLSITITWLVIGFLHSQSLQCTGTLGENIFTEGAFGSGMANVLATDPGIAPGFQYTTFVPPDDGQYTITNDMGAWDFIFSTWLTIGDNSTDPIGYMMVVNASFTPGIFYEQTIDGLCDNTLYEFSADVINVVRQTVASHILPDVSFLIDSVVEFTTGPIPQYETWKTYGFTFTTKAGQEEVTLTLRNNAPGGIGNDLALDNISFRPCGPTTSIDIDMDGRVCENALYPTLTAVVGSDTGYVQWQISTNLGMSWTDIPGATNRTYRSDQLSAQRYLFRYIYGNTPQHLQNDKCRIISSSKSIDVVPVRFTIIDTLCEGLSFDLGGTLYSTTGIYQEELTASNGCDSIVTLELTIVQDPDISAEIETMDPACAGGDDGLISVVHIDRGTPPYHFTVNDGYQIPIAQSTTISAGVYEVIISDRFLCMDVHVVHIIDPAPFVIVVEGTPEIILGHSTQLSVSGNYPIGNITWRPRTGLSCDTCITTASRPLQSTNYVASAVSDAGCIASDSLLIHVNTDPRVFIPNVFSPNGDQINDFWGIYADPLNVLSVEEAIIFDRWGNTLKRLEHIPVTEAENLWNGRDGTEMFNTGVYVYLLKLQLANDTIVALSGTITVLR